MRKAALATVAIAALLGPHSAQSQSLGGIASGVTGTVTGTAGGAVSGVGGAIGGVGGAVGGIGGGAIGGVGGAIGGVGGAVGGVGGAVGGVGGAVGGVGGAVGGVGGAVGGVGGGAGGTVGGIGGPAGGIGGGGAGAAAAAGPATTGSIGTGSGLGAGPASGLGGGPSIRLPTALAPCGDDPRRRKRARGNPCGPRFTAYFPDLGPVSGTRDDVERFRSPLTPRPGTPQAVVQSCRTAIVASALPYGVMRVDAASAGPMQSARGGFAAPVEFRIVYKRQRGLETRQATINCRMNAAGRVLAAA
ncbi:MAG TPA: hypothetical protein VFY72_03175 [Beijerinckiaceae bacterium]|nr:hypothetical protein [Beijerinckiaceae bacterium]